jgi:hypothetical protein
MVTLTYGNYEDPAFDCIYQAVPGKVFESITIKSGEDEYTVKIKSCASVARKNSFDKLLTLRQNLAIKLANTFCQFREKSATVLELKMKDALIEWRKEVRIEKAKKIEKDKTIELSNSS